MCVVSRVVAVRPVEPFIVLFINLLPSNNHNLYKLHIVVFEITKPSKVHLQGDIFPLLLTPFNDII